MKLSLCLQFQKVPSDPAAAEKLELMKMRTLERRAKTNELQRLRKAQVSGLEHMHGLERPDFSSLTEYSLTRIYIIKAYENDNRLGNR